MNRISRLALWVAAVFMMACGVDSAVDSGTSLEEGLSDSSLQMSTHADRSGAITLNGATASGVIYVFLNPGRATVRQVDFYLDQETTPRRTERLAPFDFMGGAPDGSANPFDTS